MDVKRIFGIDLRTLALFRICLGTLILADLINRAGHLTAFYTDKGVLTRVAAIEYNDPVRLSLYMIGGSPEFVALLFLLAGILAILLILGYRTRLVTVLSWVFLISISNRNLFVQQAGDTLLVVLTFWAMFLPIGARYSIDAALRPDDQPQPPDTYFSVATFAILLQVIYVYVIGALLKHSPVWMPDGLAVYYALHNESLATPLAHWFRQFGPLLKALTYFVWTLELIAPLLVFSPIWHLPLRLVAMVLLIAMHLGFFIFLEIVMFPFISITSLLLLTPSEVWDWLGKRVYPKSKQSIKIYYDGDCGFCLKTAKIFRTFCLPDGVPILPAQKHKAIRPIFEAEDSWVVSTGDGNQLTKWTAVAFVLRQSPIFWIFGKFFEWAPAARFGDRLYRFIGDNRSGFFGRLSSRFLPYRRQWMVLSRLEIGVVCLLAVMVFAHNLTTIKNINYELPKPVQSFQKAIRLNQVWSMFAPKPNSNSGWLVIRGVMNDGSVVDLWHETEGEPDTTKPRYISKWYVDYRWRKYIWRIVKSSGKEQRANFARYYCGKYNSSRSRQPRLERLSIDYHRLRTKRDYRPPGYKVIRLINWRC